MRRSRRLGHVASRRLRRRLEAHATPATATATTGCAASAAAASGCAASAARDAGRAPLSARLAGVSVAESASGRTVVIRLVVGSSGEAIVRLIRSRELVRTRQPVAAGTRTLRVRVPQRVTAGPAWVVVSARDTVGRVRQVSRLVRLPAPPAPPRS